MLGISKLVFFCMCCISSCIWTSLKANPLIVLATQEKNPSELYLKQAHLIENEFDLHELIRLIVQLRDYVVSRGGYFPRLTAFLEVCKTSLIQEGVEIDDVAFDALWAEFARYEESDGFPAHQIKHHKHKNHHKKHKEIKISSKMCTGFLKFVGGSLLCLIPVPMIQGAGASLAIVGVSEMVDGAREQSDKKEWEERMDANRRVDSSLTDSP